jgi:protein-tyrosine phosphatase
LLKEGITHIINVTKDIPFYHENSNRIKIEYLNIPVDDFLGENIQKHFDKTNEFIDKVKQQNGKVLVHCQAGISRSPTIVIAYMIKNEKNLTLDNALKYLKKIRSIVSPKPNFAYQLILYYKDLLKEIEKC